MRQYYGMADRSIGVVPQQASPFPFGGGAEDVAPTMVMMMNGATE
jgi:hypothetical protein